MFKVDADSLDAYLKFDPKRRGELEQLDALLRRTAPMLKRHFHSGTPAGEAGMRMKMIGYGKFRYASRSGAMVEWPVIGVALQKNYISVYVAVTKAGVALVPAYSGKLGEKRTGGNNFSFERFDDLHLAQVSKLLAEAQHIFEADPQNPVRYMQGE